MASNSTLSPEAPRSQSPEVAGPTHIWPVPRRGSSRVYLFSLVTMSMFLLAVVASGSIVSVYRAETAVVLRGDIPKLPTVSPEILQTQWLASENLLPALAKVGLDEWAAPRVQMLAKQSESGAIRAQVSYTDADGSRATALVNEMAERCAASHRQRVKQHFKQTLRLAEKQVEQTLLEKQQLDREIQRYLDEILPRSVNLSSDGWKNDPWRRRLRVLRMPRPLTGEGTMVASATDGEPDAQEIRRELAEQERRLEQLRHDMQDEHPEVQRVLLDIQQLKASLINMQPLESISPTLGAASERQNQTATAAESTTNTATITPQNTAPQTAHISEAQAAAAKFLQGYRTRYEVLNTRHQTLAQAAYEASERYQEADELPLAHIEPVRRAPELDRERWQGSISLLAAFAGLCGLGMLWLAKRGDQAFYSRQQIDFDLGLPVLGQFATQTWTAGRIAYTAQRGIRGTCEGVLAVLGIWFFMLAALDVEFRSELTHDPLAAIALAWQHTLG